jgi:hypothetical protein
MKFNVIQQWNYFTQIIEVKNGLTMIRICKEIIAYTFQNFEPWFCNSKWVPSNYFNTIWIFYKFLMTPTINENDKVFHIMIMLN